MGGGGVPMYALGCCCRASLPDTCVSMRLCRRHQESSKPFTSCRTRGLKAHMPDMQGAVKKVLNGGNHCSLLTSACSERLAPAAAALLTALAVQQRNAQAGKCTCSTLVPVQVTAGHRRWVQHSSQRTLCFYATGGGPSPDHTA